MRIIVIALVCFALLAGASSATNPAEKVHSESAELAMLKPGTTYVRNFSREERHAACVVLGYDQDAFNLDRCLSGHFAENPWYDA